MSTSPLRTIPPGLRLEARRNLSGSVITIELTLISVLAGVVLFPLMESATPVVRTLDFEFWPYVLAGLMLIMWFWTGVISHSLTFVSWPIDIGHYLLYMLVALLGGIQMHFITDPVAWYSLLVAESAGAAVIFHYDLRLIRERMADAAGNEALLLEGAFQRQIQGRRLALWSFLFSIFGALLVLLAPGTMLGHRLHVLLCLASIGWLSYMLLDSIRSFNNLRELILINAATELTKEE
jgi:hypothetical protein